MDRTPGPSSCPVLKTLTVLLILASSAFGQAVTVPAEIKVQPGRMARIVATTTGKKVKYVNVYDSADIFREYSDDPAQFVFRFIADAPGTYKLGFYTDGPSDPAYCTVTVGTPTPPVPPNPVPIPGEGLRVMIIYETDDLGKIPASQSLVVQSGMVRAYLDSKCVAGSDGKTKEYRIWDKDVNPSGESKLWQDAFLRTRKSVPWIIVSNGKDGFEGPLPLDADKTLDLLKKYGG